MCLGMARNFTMKKTVQLSMCWSGRTSKTIQLKINLQKSMDQRTGPSDIVQ